MHIDLTGGFAGLCLYGLAVATGAALTAWAYHLLGWRISDPDREEE